MPVRIITLHPQEAKVHEYRVVKDGSGVIANNWQLELELHQDECLRIHGEVYRIRSVSILGPAADNRREVHVSETLDTVYVAALD